MDYGTHETYVAGYLIWLVIPWCAFFSAAKGGNPHIPLHLAGWLLALPFLLFWPELHYWAILGYLGAVGGIMLGHGRGFDYHLPFKVGSSPERVEIFIPHWVSVYWQKFLIMLLTGLAVTLVVAIMMAIHGYMLAAAILFLSGSFKSLAYMVDRTPESEVLRGLFLGLGIVAALCSTH